jgi:hypothetical protein
MCNVLVKQLVNSQASAFVQLIIGLTSVLCLGEFIVACKFGTVRFMFVYFRVFFCCIVLVSAL